MAEEAETLRKQEVCDGPFTGWWTWGYGQDPYETLTGPFYFQKTPDGVVCATLPEQRHLNGSLASIHGGFLMTFADFAIFAIAMDELEGAHAVTLSLTSEFLAAGKTGARLEARGGVTRATRSLVFVRGHIEQSGTTIFTFNGILKKLGK
jgi:acyl-coenzyme A thioesterase 13